MTFDAECRKIFIRICKSHGLDIEEEAIYGGQEYLEKNDYILKKQKKELSEIIGQTKCREIMGNPHNGFTVRIGNRLYAHKDCLDKWLVNQIL